MQTIGNADFDVVIKIDSPLFATDGNTSQGLMVLHGDRELHYLCADDGWKQNRPQRTQGRPLEWRPRCLQDGDFSQYQNPMYLRLTKTGSAYDAHVLDGWCQLDAGGEFHRHRSNHRHRTLRQQLQRGSGLCCAGGDVSQLVRCSAVNVHRHDQAIVATESRGTENVSCRSA